MLRVFDNISFKIKLILAFIVIISLSAVVSFNSYKLIGEVSQLVYTTYDKALMSGNFAQSAKFNYSHFENTLKKSFLTQDTNEFKKLKKEALRTFKTLDEDIDVVNERSMSDKKEITINRVKTLLKNVKTDTNNFLKKKESLLSKKQTSLRKSVALIKKWDSNSNNQSLYKSLNILFDEAAETGYIFRLDSEEKNNKNIDFITTISIASIALSILLSILISYLIISPLKILDLVCKKVNLGDYSTRSKINSKDEFGNLSHSFNHMLDAIEQRDESMETLLSSLPFALFYFNSEGQISKERSEATTKIFPQIEDYSDIFELFNAFNEDCKKVKDVIDTMFAEIIPFHSSAYLLPQKLEIESSEKIRTIELSYKPVFQNKKFTRVIMVAKDITEVIEAKKKSAKLTEKVMRVAAISSDILSFTGFIEESSKQL